MSFPPGKYKITSILEGVTSVPSVSILPSQPVGLDHPVNVWTLTPQGHSTFLFHLDSYPVTTVDSEDTVIVSRNPEEKQVTWYVVPVRGQSEYIIKPDNRPYGGWTVVRDPNHQPVIKIEPLGINPGGTDAQVFRFERYGE